MADLFHLDDELNQQLDDADDSEEVIDSAASPVDDDLVEQDREIIDLPPALAQAAKQKTVEPASFEDDRLDLQDFAANGNLQERDEYDQVQRWWVEELQAPELLPWDGQVMSPIMEAAFSDEDLKEPSDDLEAILNDIRLVDKERVQFVVANLLQARLRKIQACPWFYMNNKERLSKAEVGVLSEISSPVKLLVECWYLTFFSFA